MADPLAARTDGFLGYPRAPCAETELADPVELAVIWVWKAHNGSSRWVESCSKSQLEWYRLRQRTKLAFKFVMALMMLLALFEKPSWCLADRACGHEIRDGDMDYFGLPVLPFQLTNTLELVCVVALSTRLVLRKLSLGTAHNFGPWQRFAASMLAISFIDCTVATVNTVGLFPTTFRVARLCRPLLYLSSSRDIRRTVSRVVRSVPLFWEVLASLAICVFVFVWIGIILYAGSAEGDMQLNTWAQAFASMWVLYTTANDPDVWLPAYNDNRWSIVFFAAYLIISLYLLNNVLLAAVYDSYKDLLKQDLKSYYGTRRSSLERAFQLLANESGVITQERWSLFHASYCQVRNGYLALWSSPAEQAYNTETSALVYRAMQVDHQGGLGLSHFRQIISVLTNEEVYIASTRQPPQPAGPAAKVLFSAVHHGVRVMGTRIQWDSLVDVVIFMDVIVAALQTVIFMLPGAAGRGSDDIWTPRHFWHWIGFGFTCFYALELPLRVATVGMERFWNGKPFRNRSDLLVVCGLISVEVAYSTGRLVNHLVRLIVLLRMTRGIRLLKYLRPFRNLATILIRLMPTYRRLGILLLLIFYIYATVGEQCFGGQIRRSNPALAGSDFATTSGGYWALNFNDFASGMVTLFVLMVVNNWFIVADGFLLASGSKWSQVFFVSFFVVVNLVVLNILVALILDCFGTVRGEVEKERAAREAANASGGGDGDSPNGAELRRHYQREAVLLRVFQEDERELHEQEEAHQSLSRIARDLSRRSFQPDSAGMMPQ